MNFLAGLRTETLLQGFGRSTACLDLGNMGAAPSCSAGSTAGGEGRQLAGRQRRREGGCQTSHAAGTDGSTSMRQRVCHLSKGRRVLSSVFLACVEGNWLQKVEGKDRDI